MSQEEKIYVTGETSGNSLMEYLRDAYEQLSVDCDTYLIITVKKVSREEYEKEQ